MPKDEKFSSLFSGERVLKSHERMEACGNIDELSSHIGLLLSDLPDTFRNDLHNIQRVLFGIAACASGASPEKYAPSVDSLNHLKNQIKVLHDSGARFAGFILPGGCRAAAQAHVCRTICRRAERSAVRCQMNESVPYLNALSTYFFALALHLNKFYEIKEINL